MRTVVALIGLLLIAMPAAAGQTTPTTPTGQPSPSTQSTLTREEVTALGSRLTLRGVVLAGVADPALSTGVGSPKPEMILVVQNDGKAAAKARIGVAFGNFTVDATFTGPVLTGGSSAQLFTHEGVSGTTSLRLRAQYINWELTDASADALNSAITGALVGKTGREVVRAAEAAAETVLRQGVGTSLPIFFSGSYEFGSQSFKVIDPATLVDQKFTEPTWAANLSFGVLAGTCGVHSPESPGVFLGGTVEFFERYKAPAERQICRPFGNGGLECDKFRVGAPTKTTSQSVLFESRLWFNSARLGLNPRTIYDVQEKYWNFELPVYFLKIAADVEKPIFSAIPDLAGGVTFGWRSDQDQGWYAVLFIGPTFKLPSPNSK